MARNSKAALVINFVDNLIKDEGINDTSRIHLLLDYDDLMLKTDKYREYLNKGMIDEAFAEPDVPSPWADELIRAMRRLGVSMDIYTSRVDTVRVKATGDALTEKLQLKESLFHSYFCIRRENQVLPVADSIDETVMPKDGRNIAILYCDFLSRREAFVSSDLREYCSALHALALNLYE